MSIENFLESGLLESYVLNQCDPQERAIVEGMLAEHEVVRKERDQIEASLNQYASQYSVAPSAWMRGRIMDQISQEQTAPKPPSGTNMNTNSKFLPIALGLAALVLAGLFYRSQQQHKVLQQQVQEQTLQIQACLDRESDSKRLEQQMAFLTNPNTKLAKLDWLDPVLGARGGTIRAYDNAQLGQSYLLADAMPPLGANEDYQCWVIVDGNPNPIPLSVFQTNGTLLNIDFKAGAVKFAVSIEPKGGSPNGAPTKIIMAGVPS